MATLFRPSPPDVLAEIKSQNVFDRPALFEGILPQDYAVIASRARTRTFSRREMLHVRGDSVQQVLLLLSGFVKVTQFGPSGTEVILRIAGPGDVLGASGLFSGGTHYTSAEAFRSCRTLNWEGGTFRALADQHPILHQNMSRILDHNLAELEERFREVATEKVAPRVASQLLRLHTKIGRKVNGEVEISLSREELAQMTGTTLFTVSRLFSAWEASGIVRPNRESVTILDLASLRSVSEESTW